MSAPQSVAATAENSLANLRDELRLLDEGIRVLQNEAAVRAEKGGRRVAWLGIGGGLASYLAALLVRFPEWAAFFGGLAGLAGSAAGYESIQSGKDVQKIKAKVDELRHVRDSVQEQILAETDLLLASRPVPTLPPGKDG